MVSIYIFKYFIDTNLHGQVMCAFQEEKCIYVCVDGPDVSVEKFAYIPKLLVKQLPVFFSNTPMLNYLQE